MGVRKRRTALPWNVPSPALPHRAVVRRERCPDSRSKPPVVEGSPVTFRNPFDRTEVFTFPPGTTVAQARAQVADLLFKRAQGRLSHNLASQRPQARVSDGQAGRDLPTIERVGLR